MKLKALTFLFLMSTAITGVMASDETHSTNAISVAGSPIVCITFPCPGPLAGTELIFVEDEIPVPLKKQEVLAHHLDEDTGCGCIRPCLFAKKYKLKVDIEFEVA